MQVLHYCFKNSGSSPVKQLLSCCSRNQLLLFLNRNQIWTGTRTPTMALSKWEYVKTFEDEPKLLPNCWAVVRIDGRGFHKLAKTHHWTRPNDPRALGLMNHAAKWIMKDFNEVVLSYGQSDEYSFVFRRETEIFERRTNKILTTLVSKFSSVYAYYWSQFFKDTPLQYPPSFDGRIVLYPTDQNLRDYLSWRQADCHINNLYNTTFWSLVLKGNLSNHEAQKRLSGTISSDKNEILFSQFGINYNNEPELYRKGTVLILKEKQPIIKMSRKAYKEKLKKEAESEFSFENEANKLDSILEFNCDIIGDKFWNENPHILGNEDKGSGKDIIRDDKTETAEERSKASA